MPLIIFVLELAALGDIFLKIASRDIERTGEKRKREKETQ